jgi:putative lipoprotein
VITHLVFALVLQHPSDAWFGSDKVKHFFVAAFTQSVTYSVLQAARLKDDQALAGAWGVTAAVSIAKEIHDRRSYGLFSVRDLVWDAAGAVAATVIINHAVRSDAENSSSSRRAQIPQAGGPPLLTVAVPSPILALRKPPPPVPRP